VVAPGLLLGDIIAGGASLPWPPLAGASIAALALARFGGPWQRRLAVALLACVLGYVAGSRVYRPVLSSDHIAVVAAGAAAEIEGVLRNDPQARENGTRMHVSVQRVRVSGRWRPASGLLRVSLWNTQKTWHAGDRLRLRASVRRPRNFGNPGEFNYEHYLARRGIYATAFAVDDSRFQALPRADGAANSWPQRWRRSLRLLFDDRVGGTEARVLRALILGEAWSLPEDLRQAFRRAGVSHVLAISGLHVGLVASSAYIFLRWLLSRSTWLLLTINVPKTAAAAAVVPVFLYAALAGGSVATQRAVIMIVLFLGALVVDRERDLITSLACALVAVLLWMPGSSLEPSFQLSFSAVFGLLLGLARFWPWWRAWEERRLVRLRGWHARIWRPIAVYFVVSLSALGATLPLVAFHFNQISLMGVVANAFVVPLLGSATVTLGLLAAALLPLSASLAELCARLAQPLIAVSVAAVEALSAFPGAAFRVVTPTAFELLLVYAVLIVVVTLSGRSRLAVLSVLAVVGSGDILYWYVDRHHRAQLRVTFLSVGQGDSAVVELPGGEVMVIDGGGLRSRSFDPGERLAAPFLWRRKIARVDYLVLTHPQLDHYGGLAFLAEEFAPREFWFNGDTAQTQRFGRLQATLGARGVPVRVLRRGMRRRLGAVNMLVHAPAGDFGGLGTNDRSLVLSLAFGGHQVLFGGDIERAAEGRLLALETERLRSTILKVPHHGSRTSSTAAFVAAVRPTLAVVSAGFRNPFGFPHPEVLRRYAAAGCRVLRTDADGAISLRIDADGNIAAQRTRQGVTEAFTPGKFQVDSAPTEG
jgi:competence protein ComEC